MYMRIHVNYPLLLENLSLSLCLQRRYSPGWASASFKSFLHPSRFRATIFQFLHPSLATSFTTPSSQRSLGLPLGRFPPGSLRRTLRDKSSSSWRMTCPAHLRLLSLQNFTMSFSPHSWQSSWLVLTRHLPQSYINNLSKINSGIYTSILNFECP